MSDERAFLRHTVATLAYRGAKAVRGAGAEFGNYGVPVNEKTPGKILAHIGDLLDWALAIAEGRPAWHDSAPLPWERECERFFAGLKKFDEYLASDRPLGAPPEKLFQGPIADALTHVGQIAMLRRLAGVPMKGENYYVADVTAGRVGADQAAPRKEF